MVLMFWGFVEACLGLLELKMAPRWSKMAPDGPRWPQERPRWPQVGPKMGPKNSKMATRLPLIATIRQDKLEGAAVIPEGIVNQTTKTQGHSRKTKENQ